MPAHCCRRTHGRRRAPVRARRRRRACAARPSATRKPPAPPGSSAPPWTEAPWPVAWRRSTSDSLPAPARRGSSAARQAAPPPSTWGSSIGASGRPPPRSTSTTSSATTTSGRCSPAASATAARLPGHSLPPRTRARTATTPRTTPTWRTRRMCGLLCAAPCGPWTTAVPCVTSRSMSLPSTRRTPTTTSTPQRRTMTSRAKTWRSTSSSGWSAMRTTSTFSTSTSTHPRAAVGPEGVLCGACAGELRAPVGIRVRGHGVRGVGSGCSSVHACRGSRVHPCQSAGSPRRSPCPPLQFFLATPDGRPAPSWSWPRIQQLHSHRACFTALIRTPAGLGDGPRRGAMRRPDPSGMGAPTLHAGHSAALCIPGARAADRLVA
mmetsp:Transcript_111066/g.314331  ORF Transcript_111066/g.314331 Transcript_111066/m.314331 type:complete len:378 (+) Transcript_111066:135-1268(+)